MKLSCFKLAFTGGFFSNIGSFAKNFLVKVLFQMMNGFDE